MQTTAVTGSASTGAMSNKGLSGLTGEDFMNLLIKQLQFQDPLKPMGNEEMMKQMATIRELEMNSRLTDRLESLTDQQRFGSAASLIGRHVKGTVADEEGNEFVLEGVVESVAFTAEGDVLLQLDTGDTLPLAKLSQVQDAAKS